MKDIYFYILVPVYNVAEYIRTCIESVLSQTYPQFKLILVNDGSPDDSGEICDEYADKDERVLVIHQDNKGPIAARETAINYVLNQPKLKNSFVLFLDSDDALKNNTLEIVAQAIHKFSADMIIFDWDKVCNGKTIAVDRPTNAYTGVLTDKSKIFRIVFSHWSYNSLGRKAVSIDLLTHQDLSDYYHIQGGDDLLLSLPLYKRANKVAFIPDRLYLYTLNPNSLTQSIQYENYRVRLEPTIRTAVWNFLVEQDVWNSEDFECYLKYVRVLLRKNVQIISGFKTSRENKFRIFEEIRNDDYYSMVLNSATFKDTTLLLLRKKKYLLIIMLFSLRRALSRLRKYILKGKKNEN
ncbi:MAG: glycosyltransferase family 2 protein [Clostridiaceae bacterium]|jgi:glycosyltransferase involved in cell wall biosynthesis|nr:glycosyltransferase family 2 protein [Clostridiaceae bacterium]